MFKSTSISLSLIAAFSLSSAAFAAPPVADDNTDVLMEKMAEKLADHQVDIAKGAARLKRTMSKAEDIKDGDLSENFEVMADVMEEVFAEDGLFRDLTAMFTDFAEDIEVDTDGGETVLSFDGAEIGKMHHSKSRDSEDSFSISGLGRYFSFDRKTVVEDGKSKTRIIIDMDGEDEIDVTLPDLD